MNNTFLLMIGMMVSFAAFGQTYNYKSAWESVEKYQKERKPESAIKVLKEIEQAATKEENGAQRLKVFGSMPGLIVQDIDQNETDHIDYLLENIDSFISPYKQVGHLVIHHYLKEYYNQNLYLIQDRTKVSNEIPQDIKEWSPQNYEDALLVHLEKAIESPDDLVVPVKEYEPILNEYNIEGSELRPYLVDVVAFQIMELLQNPLLSASDFRTEENIVKYYAPFNDFLDYNIPANYSKGRILNLYQIILKIHSEKNEQKALLDADILRIKYVHSITSSVNRDSFYLIGLQNLKNSHTFSEAATAVDLEKAQYLFSSSFQDGLEKRKKEAYDLVNEMLSKNDKNPKAQNLLNRITQKKYNFTNRQVYSSEESLNIKIASTNISSLSYSIARIPDEPKVFYRKNRDQIKKYIKTLDKIDSGKLDIIPGQYYEETQNEFAIKNPGLGYYAIYFESNDGFNYSTFYISDLAHVVKQKGDLKIMVVNRITGQPIENAQVGFYLNVYDRTTRSNQYKLLSTLQSDKCGEVNFSAQDLNGSLNISVTKGNDKIFLDDSYYIYNSPSLIGNRRAEAFILTDRAIYRPGQTVHFKAILIGYDGQIPSIEQKEEVVITLKDANGSEVYNKRLTSNEFGSVASSFTLPSSGLTGGYSLMVSEGKYQGYKQIQVEEYRRPKFEVVLEKPTESFRLGDSVSVNGNAISFASVPISDAEVSYNVYRRERRWWWSYYRPSGDSEVLITSGKTNTNDEGVFSVDFVASGDASTTYIFRVEVDVLDLSGETQSSTKEITVSEKPFFISADAVSLLDRADTTKLTYYVQNNVGEEVDMPTSYRITLLVDPGYIIDVLDRNSYRGLDDIVEILKKWKEKGVVKSDYNGSKNRSIDLSELKAGGYKIEFYAGDQTFTKYIAISDRKNKAYPFVQALYVHQEKDIYAPGEQAKFVFGTPYKELQIFIEVERNDQNQEKKWLKISKQRTVDFQITERDYGGFGIKYWAVKKNRMVNQSKVISVPWNHKKLQITYGSFRDNLMPGQDEKWIVKISGDDKNILGAELCAALYDMSLDQFRSHEWKRNFFPSFNFSSFWRPVGFDKVDGRQLYNEWNHLDNTKIDPVIYPVFDLFNLYINNLMVRRSSSGVMMNEMSNAPAPETLDEESSMSKVGDQDDGISQENIGDIENKSNGKNIPIRQNLEETVFFMPQLSTDQEGNVIMEFKMGEALTKWKLLLFAHDQELRFVFDQKEIVTKKDLMVIPYAPRFLRQGDKINFSGKVSNLSSENLSANVRLKILNALTGENITNVFLENLDFKQVLLKGGGSESVSFNLNVPENFIDPIEYQLVAEAGNFSDGESGTLPVITNKIYVTETKAFSLATGEKYAYNISDLIKNGTPISLGFDYTAHPIWSVIQALPTLSDYPHDCTEQLLNKYFAQALGNKILTSIPNIDNIIEEWMQPQSSALLSNLEKNMEFKSTTLENTPWVMDARNETAQKRALGQFLNKNALHYKKIQLLEKLIASQNNDGGFPWFKGGRSNVYITQYLLENIARMKDLGLLGNNENGLDQLIAQATSFIDQEAKYRYEELLRLAKAQKIKMEEDHVLPIDIHYLYVVNLLGNQSAEIPAYYAYYYKQANEFWSNKSDMSRALIAKVAFKNGLTNVVDSIMESFNQRVLSHPELGAYWKTANSYHWYQLPIETHTAILELYQEVDEDNPLIQEMQLWLLNHKRTNAWPTTKSTASAIYALLKAKNGSLVNWTSNNNSPDIKINDKKWEDKAEAASGYIQKNWVKDEAKNLRSIQVVNNNNNVAWGGLYVRYLAPIDEIVGDGQGSISVSKALFVKRTVSGVEQLIPITGNNVKVGEKLISRIIIKTDRDMSFLHLKDMRASGLEPINVISNYEWSGGIGYYQSTRDVATHFFIDYLPKGKYVFEYELRVSHSGEFANGITTLQSMYAPEFSSHSSSSELIVE